MAIPLTTQLFSSFLGQEQGVNSILLPDVFSSGGCNNMAIDKYARAKVIDGFAKQNAAAIVSNGGATSVLVRAILPFRATGGGSITRQVLAVVDDGANFFEVWKSTNDGGTYSFVYQAGAGSVGAVPDAAQFGDVLYFTDGIKVPQKWDSTTWSSTGRTQSPTPTATASATTGLLLGNYAYKLLSITSGGTRKAGSLVSSTVTRVNNQMTVTWTADSDVSVVGYELYRTTGTGTIFYFCSYIDGRLTTTFTDNVADQVLLENRRMQEHGDAPPIALFLEPHKQRMWYFRTSANPTRAFYSDAGLPEDVYINNLIDFSDSETAGDRITGATGNFRGLLIVWTEKTVWVVSGTGTLQGNIVDWNRRKTNVTVGNVSHRTVTRVPAGALYVDATGKTVATTAESLAFFSSFGDIRLFDGDNDTIISEPVSNLLSTFNYAQRAKTFVLYDASRNEITWVWPDGSSVEPNKAVTWNYLWGVWYPRDWTGFAHAAPMDTATAASLLLAGSNSTTTGGFTYQLWTGNAFDGTNINGKWMTRTVYGRLGDSTIEDLSRRKRWRWVDLLIKSNQTQTFLIEWMQGNAGDTDAATGSQVVTPSAGRLLTTGGTNIDSVSGSRLAVGLASAQIKVILKDTNGRFLHHEGLRLRLSSNNQLGSWAVESLNLAYQVLPGPQRRMR